MRRAWLGTIAPLVGVLLATTSPVVGSEPTRPTAVVAQARETWIDGARVQAARPRQRHVLVLYSPARHRAVMVWEDGFWDVLTKGSPAPVHLHTEYGVEVSLAGTQSTETELRQLLQRKYGRVPLDLVVAVGGAALRFAQRHRATLFNNAPIVFGIVVRKSDLDLAPGPDVTGVWLSIGWAETLDAALRLQPDTRSVALVSGTSDTDRSWVAAARDQLAPYEDRVQIIHLTDLPVDAAMERVAALPERTVVLLGPFLRDADGRPFVGAEARAQIAAAARAAVYSPLPTPGIVGGHLVRFDGHAAAAARLAAAVLRGERPPPEEGPAGALVFDARELDRLDLDADDLPPDSAVYPRETSAWDRYRWHILAALAFAAAQSALIGGLLVQRGRHHRAQHALTERLGFERLLSELSASFIALAPGALDQAIDQALGRIGEELDLDRVSLLAINATEEAARATNAWNRPDVRTPGAIEWAGFPWIAARLSRRPVTISRLDDLPPEAALDRATLAARGVRSLALVPITVEGTLVGALACTTRRTEREWDNLMDRLALLGQVFANVRARQRSDAALRDSHARVRGLAGRLLRATEDERRRIAREIHDDLGQKVAALGLGLGVLERRLHDVEPPVRHRIAQLHERIAALGAETRRLSHDLHPAALQYAGLAAGLREHCGEFQIDTGIEVDLELGRSLDTLPPDVALCLYRVTQEALANVARHSGAGRVTVAAGIDGKMAALTVRDAGVGFDAAAGPTAPGLGLVSMTERVRLLGGRVEVRSAPGQGTEVRVLVPLAGEAPAERAS